MFTKCFYYPLTEQAVKMAPNCHILYKCIFKYHNVNSWCLSQHRIHGCITLSQASNRFIRGGYTFKTVRAGQFWEKQENPRETGLGIYYTQNKRVEHSWLKGGFVGVLRWLLADRFLQSRGTLFVLNVVLSEWSWQPRRSFFLAAMMLVQFIIS